MSKRVRTRRAFLVESTYSAAAGWLSLQLPWLGALSACARDDARNVALFTHLSVAEARAMRAFAAQLIPSDDGPGAEEAGAVYFVDRAFGLGHFAPDVPIVRSGLADLDARARVLGAADFAALADTTQINIMKHLEHTPFFATARTLVIIGTFADPSYGGNKNHAGLKLIGIDHRPKPAA
jgi:gluconate 2-dehydrogenase gamma chain